MRVGIVAMALIAALVACAPKHPTVPPVEEPQTQEEVAEVSVFRPAQFPDGGAYWKHMKRSRQEGYAEQLECTNALVAEGISMIADPASARCAESPYLLLNPRGTECANPEFWTRLVSCMIERGWELVPVETASPSEKV